MYIKPKTSDAGGVPGAGGINVVFDWDTPYRTQGVLSVPSDPWDDDLFQIFQDIDNLFYKLTQPSGGLLNFTSAATLTNTSAGGDILEIVESVGGGTPPTKTVQLSHKIWNGAGVAPCGFDGGISSAYIKDLFDVDDALSPSAGDFFVFDGTEWTSQPATSALKMSQLGFESAQVVHATRTPDITKTTLLNMLASPFSSPAAQTGIDIGITGISHNNDFAGIRAIVSSSGGVGGVMRAGYFYCASSASKPFQGIYVFTSGSSNGTGLHFQRTRNTSLGWSDIHAHNQNANPPALRITTSTATSGNAFGYPNGTVLTAAAAGSSLSIDGFTLTQIINAAAPAQAHTALTDMPSAVNTDHDGRYGGAGWLGNAKLKGIADAIIFNSDASLAPDPEAAIGPATKFYAYYAP